MTHSVQINLRIVLLTRTSISGRAVIGVADPEWGERVAAAVVTREVAELTLEGLQVRTRERLVVYKVPSRLVLVEALPRNSMGKVTKPEVARHFAGGTGGPRKAHR